MHARAVAHHPAAPTGQVTRDPAVRVDDDARQEAAGALGAHLAAGRLTLSEYEERLEHAFAARTRGDLDAVAADLPPVLTARQRQQRLGAARGVLAGWLGLCALFITIWALTGGGYFWPVWPIMGTGMGSVPSAWALLRSADPHA